MMKLEYGYIFKFILIFTKMEYKGLEMKDQIDIRLAKKEDAEKIYALMLDVYENLEKKEVFVCDNLDYVKAHISKDGFTVVACLENGTIIGSFLIRYPKLKEDNLGRDIGLSAMELNNVVHMESAVVSPGYRGKHLQGRMLKYAENHIKKGHILLATVSPKNSASFHTLEKNGYTHILTKEKYQGQIRRIYQKEI